MPANKTKEPGAAGIDPRFVQVVEAFAGDRDVGLENRKGFGSGALKVNGRIFAMMSSKCQFVVKLPKNRVDDLVNRGKGQRFDPGPGRIMKEWFVVEKGKQIGLSSPRKRTISSNRGHCDNNAAS